MYMKTFQWMKITPEQLVWVGVALSLVSYVCGFSHGANPSACADMKPKHISAQALDSRNYITLQTDMLFYKPGDTVPVMVRSTRDFMGFLLQARQVTDNQIAGTFVLIPPGSRHLNCGQKGDTVTHSDKLLKRNLSFIWRAPDQPSGDIRFFITVVQSYFIYWARIESNVVLDQSNLKSVDASGGQDRTPSGLQVDNSTASTVSTFADHIAVGRPSSEEQETTAEQSTQGERLPSVQPSAHLRHRGAPVSLTEPGSSLPSVSPAQRGIERLLQPPEQLPLGPHSLQPALDQTRSLSAYNASQLCENCSRRGELSKTGPSFEVPTFKAFTSQPSPRETPQEGSQAPQAPTTDAFQPSLALRRPEAERETPEILAQLLQPSPAPKEMQPKSTTPLPASPHLKPSPAPRRSDSDKVTQFQQTEEVESRVQKGSAARNVSGGRVMSPPREAGTPGKGEKAPGKGPHLGATELGILLGCSAALGMALAAGLRYLHAQYCHKRTEVSFSDHGSNVIHVQECGDLVQVRKIRQNSFVLLQAEYNIIAPPGK